MNPMRRAHSLVVVVRQTLAAGTSLISLCTQMTDSVPVVLRVCPREAGQTRVMVLSVFRRAMTSRPFTLTGSVGALGRIGVCGGHNPPARVW